LVKRLIREYMAPYGGQIGLALVFMIIAAAMTAAFATIIEPVINEVLVDGQTGKIWGLATAVFAIFFIRGGATYIHTIMMNKVSQTIVADVQSDMFSHFMTLDLKFFHAHPSGQLIARVMSDVEVMRTAVASTMTGIGKSLITLILLVGVMFYQDWKLAIAAFMIFPPAAMFVAWIGRRLRKISGKIQTGQGDLADRLSQIFQGVRLVKAYGMEDHERQSSKAAIDHVRELLIKSVRTGNLSTPVNETLVGLVVFGIIVYGGYQVASGDTTAGELMSFITAFTLAYEPMKKLARLNNALQLGLGAADRIFDMLDTQAEVKDKDGARDIYFGQPEIEFKNVSFTYTEEDGSSTQALDDISFNVPAGKITALVGRSGSGKTTIINLIPRFYDVSSGQVLIENVDVRDIRVNSLRRQIALVSQDITIFDDSVRANIGYGKAGATDEDIIEAARAAEADEFIRELPQGYDTRLGEEGVKLSGGQRQRISIARAILRDAPVLLLDEATSALDNEAERAIQETLSKLQKGRTTLVIAHRLSTVQSADQILVLEHGKLKEQGRHEDLMNQDGIYARMYKAGLQD